MMMCVSSCALVCSILSPAVLYTHLCGWLDVHGHNCSNNTYNTGTVSFDYFNPLPSRFRIPYPLSSLQNLIQRD